MARVDPRFRSDPLVRMLGHTTVALVLFTLAYYVLPFRVARDEPLTVGRLVVSLLALVLLGLLFRYDQRRSRASLHRRYLNIQLLLTALYALVLGFALVYAALETFAGDQFVGLDDRTDALYFSVTLVATVGFGDIHPTATAAQLVATAHMLFNLVYLGTALRLLTARGDGGSWGGEGSDDPSPGGPAPAP
jgi:voltage-gated potassium channel